MARRTFLESVLHDIARSAGRAAGKWAAEQITGSRTRRRQARYVESPPSRQPPVRQRGGARPPGPLPPVVREPVAQAPVEHKEPTYISSDEPMPGVMVPAVTPVSPWLVLVPILATAVLVGVAVSESSRNREPSLRRSAEEATSAVPSPEERQVAACESGNENSCVLAAGYLMAGDESARQRGATLARASCARSALQCRIIGEHLVGRGVAADLLARDLFLAGCNARNSGACLALAQMHEADDMGTAASRVYVWTCDELHVAAACARASELIQQSGSGRRDSWRARKYRKQACQLGSPAYCDRRLRNR